MVSVIVCWFILRIRKIFAYKKDKKIIDYRYYLIFLIKQIIFSMLDIIGIIALLFFIIFPWRSFFVFS